MCDMGMYLGHSGSIIENPNATIIFDWNQGKPPAIRGDMFYLKVE